MRKFGEESCQSPADELILWDSQRDNNILLGGDEGYPPTG